LWGGWKCSRSSHFPLPFFGYIDHRRRSLGLRHKPSLIGLQTRSSLRQEDGLGIRPRSFPYCSDRRPFPGNRPSFFPYSLPNRPKCAPKMGIRENTFPYSRESADGKDNRGITLPLFPKAVSIIRGRSRGEDLIHGERAPLPRNDILSAHQKNSVKRSWNACTAFGDA
jgi:hypothetical protein